MSKLAIIPARGGSKRIPRKNIKSFLGKPIIAYSIEMAIKSGTFDEVMVSTDDEEIAEIAREYGATVPFIRSKSTSGDFATTADVIEEVLNEYASNGNHVDLACCIYPTAPLINADKIMESFELLKTQSFDCVFPVVEYSYPIQRALKVNEQKHMDLFFKENKNARSQDLIKSYHDAGQFYSFLVDEFIKSKQLWTENTGVIVLNELEVQDIDTLTDWKLAELKYELLQSIK
ncbi:pseudaminic acid cytidylyltransferase [Vicingaceae bacterium]|nr:pseudaminic acid cytidylyltransferase [Vicingaceae bacterium]